MICPSCKERIEINEYSFSMIKGIGIIKCKHCGEMIEDVELIKKLKIQDIYWDNNIEDFE